MFEGVSLSFNSKLIICSFLEIYLEEILRQKLKKATEVAEEGLPTNLVNKLMDGLLKDKSTDKIIADITSITKQQKGLKQLFHQKPFAELFDLYPDWPTRDRYKPEKVSPACIEEHATFTIPPRNTPFCYFR